MAEPCVGSFDDPASFVASELAPVFVAPVFAVFSVGHDEVDATLGESFSQRVGVVGAVGDHAFRLRSRAAFASGDFDFGKRSFSRRGTFQPNSERKTATVDQYHPLCSLAALGFANRRAPFSPEQSCRPETSPPTSAGPRHRAHPTTPATRRAIRLALSTASTAASRSPEMDTCRAKTPRRTGLQHPKNALKTRPVRRPRTPTLVLAALRLRQQRLDQLPLRIVQ